MAGLDHAAHSHAARRARGTCTGAALAALDADRRRRSPFLALFLVLPLALVFAEAFAQGLRRLSSTRSSTRTRSPALKLTLLAAGIAVPLNLVFGVCGGLGDRQVRLPGKNLLITLIDLPFAVSPVISGLMFVLLFGRQGLLGPWLARRTTCKIIFAVPGIVLATMFVTFPFVARELIPLMEAAGTEEEEAALVLGASGLQIVLPRHAAEHQVGPALRRDPLQRPRDGRVRRRVGRLRARSAA